MSHLSWSDDAITASTLLSALVLQSPPPPPALLHAAHSASHSQSGPAAAAAHSAHAAHAHAQLQSWASAQQAELDMLHKRLDIFLPTRTWSRIPLDLARWPIAELKLQHGALPTLQVRLIHACDASQANEMDQALLWLSETIGHPYPVVGLHTECDHSSVRLLQLATSSRCVLIRIPDRATLMEQAAAAAAHASSAGGAAAMPSSSLFTPLFYQFLANRQIFKSGLEACTDALQLYTLLDFAGAPDPATADSDTPTGLGIHPTHPRCEINSGLNINWNMMNRSLSGGVGLGLGAAASGSGSRAELMASLEAMCDSIIGANNSFHVDAAQTYTDWGCEFLSLRQVIYAALNAQVAYVIACTQSLPTPFHISDLPRNWILHAASWRNLQSRQQELSTACSMGLLSTEDECDSGAGSSIATPQSRSEVMMLQQLTEFMFARYTQGEEPFNPFLATLLHLESRPSHGAGPAAIFPDPAQTANALASINPLTLEASSGLAIDASNAFWWFDRDVARNAATAPVDLQSLLPRGLNQLQRAALDLMDRTRICVVEGGAGTGKTVLLAAEVLRSLARTSSINLARASPAVRMSAQRVLCVVESPQAAAHLASLLARSLPPSKLVLFAAPEAAAAWTNGSDESALRDGGYVQLIGAAEEEQFSSDREVLVCSLGFALLHLSPHTQRLLKHRQTVIIDNAQNMHILSAVLLLRKLPHTERLIIAGDSQQLSPIIAKQEAESLLTTALNAVKAGAAGTHNIPPCFQPQRCGLTVQYRFSPHLALLLSSMFYRGALVSDARMLSSEGSMAFKKRAVGWVDVPGAATNAVVSAGGSWSNRAEIAALAKLWEHYVDGQVFQSSEVAILPLYESQRHELQRLQPQLASRVFSVEAVQGREFPLVLISLAAPGVTHHLSDPRRALLALSRARYKVFIVGDREAIAPYHSIWMLVEEYAESEVAEEIVRAEAEALGARAGPSVEVVQAGAAVAAPAAAVAVAPTAVPAAAAAAAPRRATSGAKAAASVSSDDASSTHSSPEAPVAVAAPVTASPALAGGVPAPVVVATVSPSSVWAKVEPAKLLDASVAAPPAAAAAAATATPAAPTAASILAGIPAEDIPRIANLSSVFALHATEGQALLIDTLGKHFKARFGSSWRAFERLEREAKLISFLARFPAIFRLSQNLDESVHVRVEWVADAELTQKLLAASAAAGGATPAPGTKPLIPTPAAATTAPAPLTGAAAAAAAGTSAAPSSGASAPAAAASQALDPYAFESVLVSDPSLPQLDGELIDALFQALLSSPEPVLLSDLSKTFKNFHRQNWNTFTDLKLGEFLRKYSPAYFKFKNNTNNTRNPIVEVVISAPPAPAATAVAESAKSASPPVTVVASNAVSPPAVSTAAAASPPATTAAAVVAAAGASASSASAAGTAGKIRLGNLQGAPKEPRVQERTNTQDVFSAAASLASSVPASQIDDLFRLECLRLVFLDARNCGLLLTDIGNHFHALHGLRWKRLTKTELRLSDFMYSYEGVHFDFEYGDHLVDGDGNVNPLVFFRDVDRVLFSVGAGGKNKAVGATTLKRKDDKVNGGSIDKKALVPESMLRASSGTAAAAKKAAAAASASGTKGKDDFLTVTGRHAHRHPTALAASIAADLHAQQQQQQLQQQSAAAASSSAPQVLCTFCQTIIPTGERTCPNCDSAVVEPEEEQAASAKSGANAGANATSSGNASATAQPKKAEAKKSKKAAAAAAAAAAEAEAEAAAAAAAEAAAAQAAAEAKEALSSEQLYADFTADDQLMSESDRAGLSKKERRKLLWVCYSCKTSNPQADNKCQLCDTLKPPPGVIRFRATSGSRGNNANAKGAAGSTVAVNNSSGAAVSGAGAGVGSSAASNSDAPAPAVKAPAVIAAAQFENAWVRVSHTPELGYHLVSKAAIPAGTLFLPDDVLWSSAAGALEMHSPGGGVGSCIPNETQFQELITALLRDPIMLQYLANKPASQYGAAINKIQLLNLKRPAGVGAKEWTAGVEMVLTHAQFQREQAPGHSASCTCAYGRFWIKRQSALLVHSCWPNSAHVKRPAKGKEAHSLLATSDIAAGTVLTDCANPSLLSLPRDRRWQWMAQTTGKASCACDRCKSPRKLDAMLTANNPSGNVKLNAAQLESDYDSIIKQYASLNSMPRTVADDPALSSASLDDKYFECCYLFLSSIHSFLSTYHTLSPLHWRKQYLRGLFVTLVAKQSLYDLDLMHPTDKDKKTAAAGSASTTPAAAATSKAQEEQRQRHHAYLQMILTQVLVHLEQNAAYYNSHEPLKCSSIFLVCSLIDWLDREAERCLTTSTDPATGKQRTTSNFSFVFDRRSSDLSGYLADRLKEVEPNADQLLRLGFPLRA